MLFATQAFGATDGFVTRLNIVFPDGSIMFYTGANAGLVAGEEYVLISNGVRVGTCRLTRVDPYSSNAIVTSSDAPLQEGAVYTFKFMTGGFAPPAAEAIEPKKVKRMDQPSGPAPTATKAKTTEKSEGDKAETSRRRRSAEGEDEKKAETKEEEPSSKRKREPSAAKPKEEKPKEKPKAAPADRLLASSVSRENLTGMILVPTADVLEEKKARFSLNHHRISAWDGYSVTSDSVNSFYSNYVGYVPLPSGNVYYGSYAMREKATSYHLGYGITERAEVSVAARKTDFDVWEHYDMDLFDDLSTAWGTDVDARQFCDYTAGLYSCQYPASSKSTEIAFKYHFRVSDEKDTTPLDLAGMVSWEKIRYRDYRFGHATYDESNNSTRYFTYGLIGSVTISDEARAHVYWGRERERYHSPNSYASGYTRRTNRLLGAGLSYKANELVDLFFEYFKKEEPWTSNSTYEWETIERSFGIRYRLREDILINGSYIDYDRETNYADFDDHYWRLGLDYLL